MYDIKKYTPCAEGAEWYAEQSSTAQAWSKCHRGDWMLWIASRLGVDKRLLSLAKAKIAETVLPLMKDERSVNAVKMATLYGKGEVSDKELKIYAADAYAADAGAGYAYAAAYAAAVAVDVDAYSAAHAAAHAAAHGAAAAAAAAGAAAAAYAVAAAAATDAADVARTKNQLLTANICRQVLTKEVEKHF